MKKSALKIIFSALLVLMSTCLHSQTGGRIGQTSFLVDASKPYVYLEVDHIGPRKPRSDEEPNIGIWLRLHNNCQVAIIVRTFGIPPGSPTDEVGILDNVVENPKENMGDGVVTYMSPMTDLRPAPLRGRQSESKDAAASTTMPHGYIFPTSSYITIAPGQSVYFSLPINHVSDEWHTEISFRFDIKNKSQIRSPYSFVDLYKADLSGSLRAYELPGIMATRHNKKRKQ